MTSKEMELLLSDAEHLLEDYVKSDLEGLQAKTACDSAIASVELVRLELERIKERDAVV